MSTDDTQAQNSYKVVKTLFNRQQDFVIVGLCGKTGSGVSTVAQILRQDFDALNLSPEAPQHLSTYAKHEYHILYNYARKNWSSFYLIKTRALIVARILAYSMDSFVAFLEQLARPNTNPGSHSGDGSQNQDGRGAVNSSEHGDLIATVQSFFDAKMTFSIGKQFRVTGDLNLSLEDFLSIEGDPLLQEKLLLNARGEINESSKVFVRIPSSESTITFIDPITAQEESICVNPVSPVDSPALEISICNSDLYKLFRYFQHCRESKKGNLNPIYYWILQEYIFSFLPEQVNNLWDNLKQHDAYSKIETAALQLIGNNLRIGDKPYEGPSRSDSPFFKESAYATIAKDINHSIKILRAYLSKKTELKNRSRTPSDGPNQESHVLDNEPVHTHALVVIDSIKNPFESMYLKQRYSNYYLIGVYTDERQRQQRLINSKKFSIPDIKAIDHVEQLCDFKESYNKWKDGVTNPSSKETESKIVKTLYDLINREHLDNVLPFIIQNVSSCLESADIFINNSDDNRAYLKLKHTLLRYISLMMNPGLVLPTDLERCMQTAYVSKVNSGCISRQVGAVVTDNEYHLLSVGWNQQPPEQLPCLYRDLCEVSAHHDPDGYSDYENDDCDNPSFQNAISACVNEVYASSECALKANGKHVPFCFKDIYNEIEKQKNQVHTRALHAEETAFLNLSGSSKESVRGGYLFTTSSPCVLCAKKAKYLGISKIYYVDPYPDISFSHVLMAGPQKSRPEFILFTGAIGTAYTRLFTPLLPVKDEHELWMGHKTVWKPPEDKTDKTTKSETQKEGPHE